MGYISSLVSEGIEQYSAPNYDQALSSFKTALFLTESIFTSMNEDELRNQLKDLKKTLGTAIEFFSPSLSKPPSRRSAWRKLRKTV